MAKYTWIRKVYLYLFSLVGLVLIVVGAVRLVDLGLKVFIFTEADIQHRFPGPRSAVKLEPSPVSDGETIQEVEGPSAEELEAFNRKEAHSRRQRDAASALASIIVGAPLYFYHWRLVKKDKEDN